MERRRLIGAGSLGAVLVALALGCRDEVSAPSPTAARKGEQATVAWVNDGDTLTLTNGSKVRLLQVDAPELGTDCYGRGALKDLIRLARKGTKVTLVKDSALDDRDRYGRLLRYVFVRSRNLNVAIVRSGAASPYFFRRQRGRYAAQLERAVADARRERAGYWDACPNAELNTGLGSLTGRR